MLPSVMIAHRHLLSLHTLIICKICKDKSACQAVPTSISKSASKSMELANSASPSTNPSFDPKSTPPSSFRGLRAKADNLLLTLHAI